MSPRRNSPALRLRVPGLRTCQEMWERKAPNPSLKGSTLGWALVPELGDELLEPVDRAASAHARVDRVAPRAQPFVLRLEVEAAVEVERRAVLVELGADSDAAAGEDEIDLLRARKQRPLDRGRRDALRPLALLPLDPR